jgi:hypothetical protein
MEPYFHFPLCLRGMQKDSIIFWTFINMFELAVCVEESLTELWLAGLAESALICSVTSLTRFFKYKDNFSFIWTVATNFFDCGHWEVDRSIRLLYFMDPKDSLPCA